MAVINVQNWSVEQVVDWVTGLDPNLSQYAQVFASNAITGQKLLNLMSGDLEYVLGIQRIGDQLLLHEAIQTLRDELQTPWTTLQTLSLCLSVRCKNYRSELTQQKQRIHDAIAKEESQSSYNHHHHHPHSSHHHHHHHMHHHDHHKPSSISNNVKSSAKAGSSTQNSGVQQERSTSKIVETIPTTSLASASYLLDAGKVLIRWLARFPFLGKLNYDEISRKLTKHCFELAVLSQRDSFADNAIEEVQYLCTKIIELCEVLINSNDSLAIQPAGIDVITLRKRGEQDWGLQFESSYWGIHQITGVKLSTPAQQSGHLERGDEIHQVNYQTVLAWPQSSVISMLHENENEVILTVKRRPRHASTNLLLLGGHHNNMYLNKLPNRKSFFERKAAREKVEQERIVLKEVELAEEDDDSSKKDETTTTLNIITKVEEEEEEEEERSKAEVRFWKLYPKPKYLIKRRATVTGASPTETRPPVTFITDDTSKDPKAVSSLNDPMTTQVNHHAPVHHRRSTPVTTHTPPPTSTTANSSVVSLHPPSVSRPPLDKSRSAPETVEETDKQDEEDDVFIGQSRNTPPTPKPRLSKASTPSPVVPSLTKKQSPSPPTEKRSLSPPPPPPKQERKSQSQSPSVETILKTSSPSPLDSSKTTSPSVDTNSKPLPTPATPPHIETKASASPPRLPNKPPQPQQQQMVTTSTSTSTHRTPSPSRPGPATPPKPLHRGILHIRSQLRKQSSSNSACALPVIGQANVSTTTSLLSSSSPRWIRQNAVFYSNKELEIINPSHSASGCGKVPGNLIGSGNENLRVKIAPGPGLQRLASEFVVMPASEVHSRPFAFKITNGDSVTYYLAAESQLELDQWMSVMTTGEVPPCSSTSVGARRSFARAPYKRSISLGSSQSPSASTSNIQTSSQTPPPTSLTHTRTPPRFYASSTNLSAYRTRTMTPSGDGLRSTTTTSFLNRSKSSSLKTDWFLRNSTTPSSPITTTSSNISSITITSKKVNRSQVATQYPTPTGTPTKQSSQPMMGVAMKAKKNSVSSSGGGSCSTSPTRKYMCPNCCNVVKIDMGTQTDTDTVKLVFYNNGESRV